MSEREAIVEIIEHSLRDLEAGKQVELPETIDESTRLFAPRGLLDSLGLVALISEVEERVFEHTQQDLVLADERSMSMKTSPFRSVRSLASYIERLLKSSS